jgi:DNA-binding transcriptional ArsR family regulator
MAFNEQVEKVVLSLEQAECLTSAVRSEVFWAFSPRNPMSVAEVARALGKSAQTLHYHANELVRVGLLVAVDKRQSRSRTELLYVHKGCGTVDQGSKGSAEHNAMRAKSFRFTAKRIVDETDAMYEAVAQDPSRFVHNTFYRGNFYLTPEQAARLHEFMGNFITELGREQATEGGIRTHVMLYARPTVGQSREWLEEDLGD